MFKNFDLRRKKVISAQTAEQIGYIRDMDIDFESGKITSVTVPREGFFSLFRKSSKITFPWSSILAIGTEYVIIQTDAENNPLAK